jgi:AcrR family transcriptional regulator
MSVSAIRSDTIDGMGRWEPNARGRLEQAAMALFETRGYDRTTVEEIAARAGLTERTFFRYFADKREVLFGGSKGLERLIVDNIVNGPPGTAPLEAVTAALQRTASIFEERRSYARRRRGIIAAHAELRGRELIKLASLAAAIAQSLRRRGVAASVADLVAELGIAIFRNAFERWVDDKEQRALTRHIQAAVEELKAVAAGTDTSSSPVRITKPSRRKSAKSR